MGDMIRCPKCGTYHYRNDPCPDDVRQRTYTTAGVDRGECGHVHETIEDAVLCAVKDERRCGGSSDRGVVGIGTGRGRQLDAAEVHRVVLAYNRIAGEMR